VRGTSNGDTFGLVTTAWERPDFVSPERPVSYATAIAFYNNESVENLVKWKPETAKFAALPLEKFIFKNHRLGRNSRRGPAGRPRPTHT